MHIPVPIKKGASWLWGIIKGKPQQSLDKGVHNYQAGGQGNITIINNITNQNYYDYRQIAPSTIEDVMKGHKIANNQIRDSVNLIESSSSYQELIYNLGAVSGSTASVAGIPMGTIRSEIEKGLAVAVWTCSKCGQINSFSQGLICSKCGTKK